MPPNAPKLGLIAGGGLLPEILAKRCRDSGRGLFVAVLNGQGDPARYPADCTETFRLGAAGKLIKHLRAEGVEEVAFAGSVRRPKATDLIPDLWTTKFLARTKAMGLGDDGLLSAIVQALETEEGFRVVGPSEIAPELLAPAGAVGSHSLSLAMAADLAAGIAGARDLGRRDIGQAVIAKGGKVICEEGPEGTEALVRGAGEAARGGILVKAMKPAQEARVDLPASGPDTVDQAVAAGLAGIAVEAGRSLMLDRETMVARADAAGIVLYGFSETDATPDAGTA